MLLASAVEGRFFTKARSALPPVAHRMPTRGYVDRFFESGVLRAGSFLTFREHKDRQRKDDEAKNTVGGRSSDDTVFAAISHGIGACGPSSSRLRHAHAGHRQSPERHRPISRCKHWPGTGPPQKKRLAFLQAVDLDGAPGRN
jgi:hypothetical protein